ncbi:MAG: alpha/beta hydrolase [Singulisphaera sp.]
MLYSTLLSGLYRAYYGKPAALPAEREDTGLVLVADGVGGLDLCGTALRHVIGSAGEPCVVRIVPWGHGLGRWHADLTNAANHDAKGRGLAVEVAEFKARRPGAPVFLVGKSGGTGLVARALERLPEGTVEAAVLLAPALSPGYDLTRALRAVRREMVVFWSPMDVFVLGLGTRLFGTIDRRRVVSAGLVGFRRPEALDEQGKAQYAKLRQVRWRPVMARTGYLGGHVGPDSPAFLRRYVVPLLRVGDAADS